MDNSENENVLIIEDIDNLPAVDHKTAVVIPDGRQGFLYPSGSLKDAGGRFLVSNQPGAVRPFNRENAQAAVKKRDSRRSEAVQAAIIKGTKSTDINEGIERIAAEIVAIILKDGGQARDKIQAFKELMRFGGLAADLSGQKGPAVVISGGSGLSNEALQALNTILPALESRLNSQE